MNLLALDIATTTGWATEYASGTWDLSIKRDESAGMKLIRFRAKLKELHDTDPLDVIVWEKPAGQHKSAIIHASRLVGAVMLFCEENSIQWSEYSASDIKKHATGKGNANKEKMIEAAKHKWQDVEVIDDNHADALWLNDLAKKLLNL